ncbi:RNA polymerase sigma factor [Paenibacillus sp. P2(2022)]|uniref:RNA polymerase sigma factor n=1 Tax=Paenibacillus TaxID=44249 RepID=UPI0004DFCBE6|nr:MULTISPECIES: RNA polymerase sigma factor [Paenibacillus]AUS28456.1 DNA-directed RNA polymerase subunit sigma [Paenibacillus polymyxa]KAF6561128.1 RNA polymerase sigma factor [Paenibacillus sp. EKM202P]KAF6565536.1 RNA polymerase sigma factor [Paenibacillus sp. EKM207P]KJK29633.1 DNA-directed RNA polymerase subunit sigma [Paenibacillus polymyxa]MDG0055369.1 RNA polymerase sigma factor [Paenibacillus sp. P2(2022)]
MDIKDLEDLYLSHKSELLGYLLRIVHNKQDAEDLLHECFIRFIRASPDLPEDRIRFYLLRIAKNLAIDIIRKRKKMEEYFLRKEHVYYHWDTLDFEIQDEVDRILLMASNTEQRTVLKLRVVQGYSIKETARILNKSENSVKSSLHRASKRIKLRYIS